MRYAVFHAHTHAPRPGVYLFIERVDGVARWACVSLHDTIEQAEARRDALNAEWERQAA